MIYLDWAATAVPYPKLAEEAADLACRVYGNPSSIHSAGKEARSILEAGREKTAKSLGAKKEQIVFTSGGSEADSIAMLSALRSRSRKKVIISAIEHDAIYREVKTLEYFGFTIQLIKPDNNGVISARTISEAITKDTALVSVMAVNNETGAIQEIYALSEAIQKFKKANGRAPFFHCDAVQALSCKGFDARSMGVDSAAFSAHKIGGPRGIGALFIKERIEPLTLGGQEGGIRAGTENVQGAWAFAEALENYSLNRTALQEKAGSLEARLIEGIKSISGASIIPKNRNEGDPSFSPNIICMAFSGLGSETMVQLLDKEGIAVSAGAACSGARKERRVLDAMDIDRQLSFSAIRLSTGRNSTTEDIDAFLEAAGRIYKHYKV